MKPAVMAHQIEVNVDVYVSDTLKAMFGHKPTSNPLSEGPAPLSRARSPVTWQDLCLRRDGDRPIMFEGAALLEWTCTGVSAEGRSQQSLTLYLAVDGTVYAGLVFEPGEACPAWPSYRCTPIRSPTDLTQLVHDWSPEACFTPAASPGQRGPGPAAARSAFNAMAADCLTFAVLQG